MHTIYFSDFILLQGDQEFELDGVEVHFTEELTAAVRDALSFLQRQPRAILVEIVLNDNENTLIGASDEEDAILPVMVVLQVYRTHLILQLIDEYTTMEKSTDGLPDHLR